jgi:uncharacterized protein YegJ (DUF2314 family)
MSILPVSPNDPAMSFAIEEAQRTLRDFFRAFSNPNPTQKYFLLKIAVQHGDVAEHIWIANINASVSPLVGIVANETSIPGIRYMSQISFKPEQITDWMIIENGVMVGGFTNQVAIARMPKEEQRQYLASLPYRVRGYTA